MPQLRIGTSGWTYQHWRGVFYPKGVPQTRWLEFYAREFDTVELNATFYRLPRESTFAGWRARIPPGFLFAVKASQVITHWKRLREAEDAVAVLLGRTRLLEDRLGPILVQTPPDLAADLPLLSDFLALLPGDLRFAFEFRHLSWFTRPVYALLAQREMAVVRVTSNYYPVAPHTGDFSYLRMHGEEGGPKYAPETLSLWSERVRRWAAEGQHVFIYFNNDAYGFAVQDARAMKHLVAA